MICTFGRNLKALRVEHKMSQEQLAKAVGVTQQCVSEWEKNNIEPSLSSLWRLSEVFDISIDVLVGKKDF